MTRLRRRNWPKYLSLYGWFVEGMILGDCIVRYNDGSVYDGPYVDERWIDWMGRTVDEAFERDHWGVWLTPNDIVYEGPKVDNHFDITNIQGEFRVTYQNGEVYEGHWRKDKADGQGTLTYAAGDKYTGQWSAGSKHGYGELHYMNGDFFAGNWAHDQADGEGTLTYANGDKYEGQWHEDRRHGSSGAFWSAQDEYQYDGEWANGRKHGRGTLTLPTGDTVTGNWEAGEISGPVHFTFAKDRPWNNPEF